MKKIISIILCMLFVSVVLARAEEAKPSDAKPDDKVTAPKATVAEKPKHAAEELVNVSDMMKKAGELLKKLETGQVTQEEQKKIVAQLDEIISKIPPGQGGGGGQSSPNPSSGSENPQPQDSKSGQGGSGSSPATEANIPRAVTVKPGDAAPNDQQKWGSLPPGQREAINQMLNENFLPQKYKNLINLYWQALSETP